MVITPSLRCLLFIYYNNNVYFFKDKSIYNNYQGNEFKGNVYQGKTYFNGNNKNFLEC